MSFYGDLAKTAGKLLAQFGQPAVLNKRLASAYDPTAGKVTQEVVPYDITVLEVADTESRKSDPSTSSATVEDTKMLLIDASTLDVEITSNDTITVGSKTFKVVDPGGISPAGTVVVYKARVRL